MALPRHGSPLSLFTMYTSLDSSARLLGRRRGQSLQRVWLSKSSLPYGSLLGRKRSGGEASTSSPPTSAPKKDSFLALSWPLLASTHRPIISTIGRDLVGNVDRTEDASTSLLVVSAFGGVVETVYERMHYYIDMKSATTTTTTTTTTAVSC